jgi:peroxin-16
MLDTYQQKASQALSAPPKWLAAYSDFIIKNASAVSQIESALRSLTYIIPGMVSSDVT